MDWRYLMVYQYLSMMMMSIDLLEGIDEAFSPQD